MQGVKEISFSALKCMDVWIFPDPATDQEEEPDWVEVMVDILLSLLSQPSRHIRQVCKTVFSSICPHVTAGALTAILDVSDTYKVIHHQMVKQSHNCQRYI